MKPVDINIVSTIKTDEGEDKIELFTEGSYDKTENGYILRYEESEGIGYDECSVSITSDGGSVIIERTGPAASTLTIEKNIKHHCIYGTPFGEIMMGINTYEISDELTEQGGRLYFKYSIDINSDFISENEMEITIRK